MKIENTEKLIKLLTALTRLPSEISKNCTELIAEKARENAPRKTGRLRESIGIRRTKHGYEVVMGGSKAPYAVFLEYGTRPHVIRPKRARALRFEVDGKIVYARYAMHPGTHPRRIMAKAISDSWNQFAEIASRVFDRLSMRKIL